MDEEERRVVRELAESIQKRECILFLGAGVTSLSGSDLANKIKRDNKNFPKWGRKETWLATIAQAYEVNNDRDKLIRFVKGLIEGVKPKNDTYKYITELPFKVIITTNYDCLLEKTFEQKGIDFEKITKSGDLPTKWSEKKVMIIKLHGCVNYFLDSLEKGSPFKIIITEDDYWDFISNPLLTRDVLSHMLATKDFLFVGYGLQDPDFRIILNKIVKEFGEFARDKVAVQKNVHKKWKNYWMEKERNLTIIKYEAEDFMKELVEEYKKLDFYTYFEDIIKFFLRIDGIRLSKELHEKVVLPKIIEQSITLIEKGELSVEGGYERKDEEGIISISKEQIIELFSDPDAQKEILKLLDSNDEMVKRALIILEEVPLREIEVVKKLPSFIENREEKLEKLQQKLEMVRNSDALDEEQKRREEEVLEEEIATEKVVINKAKAILEKEGI